MSGTKNSTPHHTHSRHHHDAVHHVAERSRVEPRDETFGDERSDHQRRSGDQAFDKHIQIQCAEALEHDRLGHVESERRRGLGGEERAFAQAIKQEQRHAQRPR